MTIDDRKRAIEIIYSPIYSNIIKSFYDKGSNMKLDDTLVHSAQQLHNSEHNYGETGAFWAKAAQLASIKANKNISTYDLVLCHIAALETKISNKNNALTVYAELAAMYAVLATLAPSEPDPASEKLDAIEADIREMAAKLAPEMPKAELMFGSPNGA